MMFECAKCGHGMNDHQMILTMPASYECKDGCKCESFVLNPEDGKYFK